ncbi:hypothetical protein AR457_32350 [Streptomyces agglomeratus]|uniref:Uncharacterized protein n=1 Tax=Streptomyces agglomeratus TaxID=285458 RepID=A0A1E5PG46_9ACTN|nr:hypothetical protein [Streptomyces agglomeratus]OEJ28465.1 hypothetical protein AS594_32255 [Streptomyces agglomeratus]OEJ37474.1 hypothetical protein BGK70_04300 [Streptomyces agglomeratus]OEJ48142.1 hypothetical protein AR457_32350 [Streptomyces agglomeratus]OEJ50015.1 hypothetical protein BGK72_03815 [Streptomyces agglomeratus]OEJ57344.1 hypothetical protein BGM19_04495 [Streptomyces agglomeratus]
MDASNDTPRSVPYAQLAGSYWLDDAHAAQACRWCRLLLDVDDQPRQAGKTLTRPPGRNSLRTFAAIGERTRLIMLVVASVMVASALLTVALE